MNVSYSKMKVSQVLTKPGFYVLIIALISAFFWEPNQSFFWGAILYGMIILNRRTEITKTVCEQTLFDPTTPTIIDLMITECFNEYIALNSGWKDKEYISEEDEKKIISILIESVLTRMSNVTLYKMRAYYNEELVESVLTEKIYMVVMNYSIYNNRMEEASNLELESAKRRKENELINVL